MVSALPNTAVTVPELPNAMVVPLIVTELLVSEALAMFVSVLVEPLIVLFVSVVVLEAVTTATPLEVSDVNAPVAGVVAPIVALLIVAPPSIATALIVPPVMFTELAFCVDMVPKPLTSVLGIVADAVMTEVPLPFT